MIVVAIIGLLAAIAIPNFVRARVTSQQNACIENLRELDAAKQEWASDTRQFATAIATSRNLRQYIGHGTRASMPSCPAAANTNFSTSYTINNLVTPPTCNIVPETHILLQ
jgi:type II secretory pathway pseudopilin PulG